MKNKKLIIILFSIILLFFLLNNSLYIFLNNKYKINYNKKINNKNYEINIEENEEGNLSILKNELYKTTIMLKEQAENSYNDKINLKSSLEDISHQLKTPLTSINIMLDNILDNPEMDDETKLDFITDIKRETNNINFLIQALLKLSKFDTNTVKFNKEENDLKQIINEAIKNVSVLCDLKNIKIIFNCENNLNLICDKKWQIESLTNIIKNCVEYSEENNKININVENNKIYYLIKIKDYGKEINKKDLNHIFERFYKGKNSKNDSIGIGLALSKAIIEKNNGKVWAESNENETIFYVQYFK